MGAKTAGFKRGAAVTEMPLRRDSSYPNDFAGDYGLKVGIVLALAQQLAFEERHRLIQHRKVSAGFDVLRHRVC